MMISSESYFRKNLKGRDPEYIAGEIDNLRREIRHLKKRLEKSVFEIEPEPKPDCSTQLWCYRRYFDIAVKACTDAGGIYKPTPEEQRAARFNESIPHISRILFSFGYFSGWESRILTLTGEYAGIGRYYMVSSDSSSLNETKYPGFTRDEIIEKLRDLYIGEWRHKYINPNVPDGEQWEITIEYDDGRSPEKYSGSNAYPFSFRDFRALMEAEEAEYEY